MQKTLGLDIGHCMSSGAFLRYNMETKRWEVTIIPVNNNGMTTCLTQMMLTEDQIEKLRSLKSYPDYEFLKTMGEIKIGESVPAITTNGKIFRYFKKDPTEFSGLFGDDPEEQEKLGISHGTLMACFCYALVNRYIKDSQKINEEDRIALKLVVGCPATEKWTSPDSRIKYADLVKNATGVKEVQIVPESRGALFGLANSNKEISIADGVLVFDFGSLTADCTYMLLGKRLAEFSWDLGASAIEIEMFNKIAESNTMGALYTLREIKEKYFSGTYSDENPGKFITQNDKVIRINKEFMDDVIYNRKISIRCGRFQSISGSWAELCREFFKKAKNHIITQEKLPVNTIVLTGGASQMGFIAEICKEEFGFEPSFDKSTVEYAVSKGLAWVSASEEKYPEFLEKAKKDILNNKDCAIDPIVAQFKNKTYDFVKGRIKNVSDKWLNNKNDTTITELFQQISSDLSKRDQSTAFETDVTTPILQKWQNDLDAATTAALIKYMKELYTTEINNNINLNSINMRKAKIDIGLINLSEIPGNIDIDSFSQLCINGVKRVVTWFFGANAYYNANNQIQNDKQKQKTKILTAAEKQRAYNQINGIAFLKDQTSHIKEAVNKYLDDTKKIKTVLSEFVDKKIENAFGVAMLIEFEKTGWDNTCQKL